MADGATELDMVINIGQAIAGEWDAVASDIDAVTKAAHEGGAIVKVIFENCYLNDDQKVRLCQICGEVGADYVKTSTGYGTGGATLDGPPPDAPLRPAEGQAESSRGNPHPRRDDRVRGAGLRSDRRLADRRDPRRAQGPPLGLSRFHVELGRPGSTWDAARSIAWGSSQIGRARPLPG